MHIVIHDENHSVRSADISDSVDCVVFGSDPLCHVYLPDVRVAERHFHVVRGDDRQWRLQFLPIEKGTPPDYTRIFVNALEAEDGHEIRHNDQVLVSRFRLQLFVDLSTADSPRAAVMEDASKIRAHPLPSGAVIRTNALEEVTLRAGVLPVLTQFAFDLHDCTDLASLMERTIAALMRFFKARQVWMGARRNNYGRLEFVETIRSDGASGGDPPLLETYTYRCAERGQFICTVQTEESYSESAMCAPLICGRGVVGMLYVDNAPDSAPYGEQDLDMLSAFGAVVARQLELVIQEQVKLHEAISAGELSFMRELQAKMDPTSAPQWEGVQMAVYCKPGLDHAGDIYDMMKLPNGLASFVCGHVTGSATHAALAMAEARAAFRIAGLHADPPHVLTRAVNWLIYDAKNPCSMTGIGLIMNPKTGAMQYATAGRIGAAVVGHRGQIRSLVQSQMPEIGTVKDFVYTSQAGRLQEGETLVLYTPGCYLIQDRAGAKLGEDRLLDAISDGFGQPASATLDELLSDLRSFFREGRQPDDITLMVIHRE